MTGFRGSGSYPEDWPEVARRVKEEAGWRCVRCGHPDDPGECEVRGAARGYLPCDAACTHESDRRRRVLTVHHLDGDKANCRWWNLPALCQVCHLQVQAKVRMGQTYAHPHSRWFLPYVAGYYAFTVLDEEWTRDEVEGELLELLVLGQPHLEDEYRGRLG
ncbi:MAG: hypothetical protein ACLFWG_00185 [Longimicrobiales bacterium]